MINGAATRSASALAELVRFFQTKGIFGGRAVSNGTLLGAAFIPSPFHGLRTATILRRIFALRSSTCRSVVCTRPVGQKKPDRTISNPLRAADGRALEITHLRLFSWIGVRNSGYHRVRADAVKRPARRVT